MSRRPVSPKAPARQGRVSDSRTGGKGLGGPTSAAQSEDGLALPHERDEVHGQVAKKPDPVIEQAAKDLAQGQVDTDMRATPGLDADRRHDMVDTPAPDKSAGEGPPR
jgi:hypothetical protein